MFALDDRLCVKCPLEGEVTWNARVERCVNGALERPQLSTSESWLCDNCAIGLQRRKTANTHVYGQAATPLLVVAFYRKAAEGLSHTHMLAHAAFRWCFKVQACLSV